MLSLRPYQELAADHLYGCDRAMVLAPVGAGKTAATLVAMQQMVSDGLVARWLVIAPLRVAKHVWPAEAARWAPGMTVEVAVGSPAQRQAALESNAQVIVINYDNLQWLAGHDLSGFTGVVFDELTRLKNPSGLRFKALEKVIKAITIRWGLTGSFTSNGLEDVFGQCKIIDQSLLGRSKGAFQQTYFNAIVRSTHTEWEPRPGALEAVMDRIRPATFVLEAGTYTDTLPPLHVVPVTLEMGMEAYNTMRKNFVLQFNDDTVVAQNAAVVTQKLQQMSSGFVYTGDQARWMSSHKLDAVQDILEENQRAPTIVWYQYAAEKDALMRAIPNARDVRDAGAIDAWNAGKVEVLLAHPASAGHGLNLQHGGSRMIWMSLPWSLELYEQAVGRLHRSGQRHDVWCYVLQTEKTIDMQILFALHEKHSLAKVALEALK